MATQKNVSNVANQESKNGNTSTLPPSTVPNVSAPPGPILLTPPTMPVSVVVPRTSTYALNLLGPTAGTLVKVEAVSPSSVADLTMARQHYFSGITFHVLKSPRNHQDQIFGPKREAFIKANGGEIIEQQQQILPNTIVVASKDDTYNLEKLRELKQNGIIVYPEALSSVLSDHWLDGGSQFEISRFLDYVQFAIVTCNFPIRQSEQNEVTPPQSAVGTRVMDANNIETETQGLETDEIAKVEASVQQVDDDTRPESQIGLPLMTGKTEECSKKLHEVKRTKLALAFKLAVRKPQSQRKLGELLAEAYNLQKDPSDKALSTKAGQNIVNRLASDLDTTFEDLREEFKLTPEMRDCLKQIFLKGSKGFTHGQEAKKKEGEFGGNWPGQ